MSEIEQPREPFWTRGFAVAMVAMTVLITGLAIALVLGFRDVRHQHHSASPEPTSTKSSETISVADAKKYQEYRFYAENTHATSGIPISSIDVAKKVLCVANPSKDYYVQHIEGYLQEHNALQAINFVTDESSFMEAFCPSPERLNNFGFAVQEQGLTYVDFVQ